MRRAAAAALVWLWAAGAWAQALPPGVSASDGAAIREVITRQIDAFRRDDAAGAYAFAAPAIKEMFPSAERFAAMVRGAYAPVYRPRDVAFGELALRDDAVVQSVELVGPDGTPVLALYTMARDAAGGWVIAGCLLVPSARLTT